MADYSYSSSAMRRKKKAKQRNLEGEVSQTSTISMVEDHGDKQSAELSQMLPNDPAGFSHAKSDDKNEITRKPLDEQVRKTGTTIPSNLPQRNFNSVDVGKSNNVHRLAANFEQSSPPPLIVSSSSGSEEEKSEKDHLREGLSKITSSKQSLKNEIRKEKQPTASRYTDNDDSSDESLSDESAVGERALNKYSKYLNSDELATSNEQKIDMPNSLGKEGEIEGGNVYEKYRKQLTQNTNEKWVAPKRKLGAPPELAYNYRYSDAPRLENPDQSASINLSQTPDKKKAERVHLKSKKLAKDDLGVLASMLGDEDSEDDEEGSRGVFSDSSSEGQPSVEGEELDLVEENSSKTSNEGVILANISPRGPMIQERMTSQSESTRSNSRDASDTLFAEKNKSLHIDYLDASEKSESRRSISSSLRSIREESTKGPLSARMQRLQDLKKLKRKQEESHSSFSSRVSGSFVSSPRYIRNDSENCSEKSSSDKHADKLTSNEDKLGTFLDNEKKAEMAITHQVDATSKSERDDFSTLWATQSVSGVSVTKKPILDDTERSDEPAVASDDQRKRTNPSTTTVKNSAKKHSLCSEDEKASISNIRDSDAEMSYASPTLATTCALKENEDFSSESESDASLDFDHLAGLEQFTINETKKSTPDRQLNTPVITNKKVAKEPEQSENHKANSNFTNSGDESVTEVKYEENTLTSLNADMPSYPDDSKEISNVTDANLESVSEGNSDKSIDMSTFRKTNKADVTATGASESYDSPANSIASEGSLDAMDFGGKFKNTDEEIQRGLSTKGDESDGSLDALDFGNGLLSRSKEPSTKSLSQNDDGSMSDFSLNAGEDLTERSESHYNKPEYESRAQSFALMNDSLNQGFQGLDASDLLDIEAATKEQSPSLGDSKLGVHSTGKQSPSKRDSYFETGFRKFFLRTFAVVLILAAIALSLYFIVFAESDERVEVASLAVFPTAPSSGVPQTSLPVAPPSIAPVELPVDPTDTPAPSFESMTAAPTLVPTCSRPCSLRNFLIGLLPKLEDDFVGFMTPQIRALDWLANNENYETYSEDRLAQRFALAVLFFSTSGRQWRNNDGWLSQDHECSWYSGAVEPVCNIEGNMIRLELVLNDLSGTIPSEVALLSSLFEIDFSMSGSESSLRGSIPSEIGLLTNLSSLNLRGNEISSSIPSDIGGATNLVNLDLSAMRLSGSLPPDLFVRLSMLESLNLSSNQITGEIPPTIGSLIRLQLLQLNSNSFEGAIPTELGNLSLLDIIEFDNNRLSGIPAEIGNLVLLRHLAIANNRLRGTIPDSIGDVTELLSLELQNNFLTGTIPSNVGNLVEIRDTINLSQNQLDGAIPSEMGRLIFLRNLQLQNNRLTGGLPESFSFLRRLTVLRIESNDLMGDDSIPSSVCNAYTQTFPLLVADCNDLSCLCCTYCCIDGEDCTCQYAGTGLNFLCIDI